MRQLLAIAGICFASPSLGSTVTHASHALPVNIEASHVLLGQVSSEQTRWYDERLLVTTYTVEVREVVAGQPTATVTVSLPGGQWQGWTQQAAGVPLLAVGEAVVLCTDDLERVPLHGIHRVRDGRILSSPLAADGGVPLTVESLRHDLQR